MAIREVVAVFEDEKALEDAVYAMETGGLDRAAFSLLATEKAVVRRLGHRYRNIREMEDKTDAPRETFFSRVSRLESEYLPAPVFASIGALTLAGLGSSLMVLIAAGTGAALGAALGRIIHQHGARRIREQLERGGLLLWVNVRDAQEQEVALDVLRAHSAHDVHDVHVHDLSD